MNQLLFLRRSVRNVITLLQQLDGTRRRSFRVRMHGAQRFARCYRIAELAMQNNPNGRIDRVLLLLAPAAQNDASVTNRFTIDRRNMAATPSLDFLLEGSPRKASGI